MTQKYHKFTPNDDKFPYFELSILFFASMTSAIPLTGLFPYVAFMVVDIGAARNINEAGFVSGYLASAFMFGRVVSSFYWGHIADTVGRKPVAYISCTAIIVLSIVFGLSLNLWMAILSRLALGILNPFNTLTKTLISDICTKKQQPMGMSLATGSWSVGLVIGPAIGGCLARPCVQYPSVFGGNALFETFPYLLPNMITAIMAAMSVVLIAWYLPETAPKIVAEMEVEHNNADSDMNRADSIDDSSHARNNDRKSNAWSRFGSQICLSGGGPSMFSSMATLVKSNRVLLVCLAYFSISLSSIMFDEVFPLWAQSSRSVGGLGFTASTLGQIGSLSGFPMMVVTFFIFPYISKKFGAVFCFRFGQLLSTLFTLSIILVTLCHTPEHWTFPLLVIISSGSRCCAVVAFAATFLLINSSVPRELIGAVNGLAMTVGGVSKFIGPFGASIIYAWSINNHVHSVPFNFSLIFFICAIIGVITMFIPVDSCGVELPDKDLNKVTRSEESAGQSESSERDGDVELVMLDDDAINEGTAHGLLDREKTQSHSSQRTEYMVVEQSKGSDSPSKAGLDSSGPATTNPIVIAYGRGQTQYSIVSLADDEV